MLRFLRFFHQHIYSVPLFLAAVLVPVVVIPWFSDAYEVHKAALVIIASIIGGLFFLAKVMKERSLTLLWSWQAIVPLVFLFAVTLSACFSLSPARSWLGMGGGDYASVLFIGSSILFAFLFVQAGDRLKHFFSFLRVAWGLEVLLGICTLVLIYFHVLDVSPVLSFATPHTLAFFFGVTTFLFLGDYIEGTKKSFFSFFSLFLLFILFLIAFSLDSWVLWLPLFLSGVVLLSLTLARKQGVPSFSRLIPVVLLVVLPLVGWFLPRLFHEFFPSEIVPSFSLSVHIAQQVWSHGLAFFVGSGPGTYGISYELYALPTVNATTFWNVVFERGFSYILTLATIGGLFSVLSFVGMQLLGVWAGFRVWARATQEDRGMYLGLYLSFLFLSFSAWTYGWSVTLFFVYFVLFGFLFGLSFPSKHSWTFVSSVKASVFASFGFVVALVVFSLVFFVTGTRYAAEIVYTQAIHLQQQRASADGVLEKVTQAASFNRWNDVYYRELSLLLLQQINNLVDRQASSEQIQAVLGAAVNASVRATEIGPNVVQNWEVRGNVYREVSSAVSNAADFSIASFITATHLAPSNPLYLVGLGRAYLAKADVLIQSEQTDDVEDVSNSTAAKAEALSRAEEAFLAALQLKPDYLPAQYFLSAVYEREDKLADAIKSMEIVRSLNREDVGVGMQLALLYLQQGRNDSAEAELQRIIALSPTYANARWYLSVLLEQRGDFTGAILQVEEIAKTNPENEAVIQRLARLQSGEAEDDVATIPEPLDEEAEGSLEGDAVLDGGEVVAP